MNENKENQPVTQGEFKSELQAIRTDFKEAIFALKEKMQPLENLNTIIFKNMLILIGPLYLFALGLTGFLFWIIDRDFGKMQASFNQSYEYNQSRISALEAISLTPTNQVILTEIRELLDIYKKQNKR